MSPRTGLVRLFAIAFGLNLIWELLHTPLYSSLPAAIGPKLMICTIATCADALYVVIACLTAMRLVRHVQQAFLAGAGIVTAAAVEMFALHCDLWRYSDAMPVLPLLQIGLSPLLQLATTSVIVFYAIESARGESPATSAV